MKIVINMPDYFYDLVACIKFIVIAFAVYFLFIMCILPLIKHIILKARKNSNKKKLNINEFDDYDRIKLEEFKQQQLENEWEFIEEVYAKKYPNNLKKIETHVNSIKIMDEFEPEKIGFVDGSEINELLEENQDFDVNLFKKWASNIFEYVQLANLEEMKLIKNSISDLLYDKRILQLQNFERDNLELKRDTLLVKDVKIYDYYSGLDGEKIKVYIKADLKEYIINKKNKKVLKGSSKKILEKQYILTFKDLETNEKNGFIHNCPNCGGNVIENEFGRCKYCGSLINPIRYNWLLEKFELV